MVYFWPVDLLVCFIKVLRSGLGHNMDNLTQNMKYIPKYGRHTIIARTQKQHDSHPKNILIIIIDDAP